MSTYVYLKWSSHLPAEHRNHSCLYAGMLAYKCGPAFAGLTGAVIAAYTAFTIGITQWRTRFRQTMNRADSEAGKQAMDSLINFETVKLYGNEGHELQRYDRCLAGAWLPQTSMHMTSRR